MAVAENRWGEVLAWLDAALDEARRLIQTLVAEKHTIQEHYERELTHTRKALAERDVEVATTRKALEGARAEAERLKDAIRNGQELFRLEHDSLYEERSRFIPIILAAKALKSEWTACAGDFTNEVGSKMNALWRAIDAAEAGRGK